LIPITEYKLTILPGAYDFPYRLREYVKDYMVKLISLEDCAIVADFGSEKFAAGSKELLSPLISRLRGYRKGRIFTFDRYPVKNLYESCQLTIRANKAKSEAVKRLLDELTQGIAAFGGRIKETPAQLLTGR